MDLAQRLIKRWTSHGINCPPGVSAVAIAEFEWKYSVNMPSDLSRYFLTVNGMGTRGNSDDDFFSFWQLSDVKTIAEEIPDRAQTFPEATQYFLIADHSIFLPAFAIRLITKEFQRNPVALVYNQFDEIQDAFYSFTDFVEYYLSDPLGATVKSPISA